MSCDPVLVTGYVDEALPPEQRAALEAHLAGCEHCRAQAAEERSLRTALRALDPGTLPRGLGTRLQGAVRAEGRRRRRQVLLAVAAVLVLALGWLRVTPAFVALELSRDHGHCFSQPRLPAKVWSNDAAVVTRWFEKDGTRLPLIPDGAAGLELVGARYCGLPDASRAAHLYYEGEDGQLSLFVVRHHVSLDGPWARLVLGRAVVLAQVDETTVGLVSDKPELVEAFRHALTSTAADAGRPPEREAAVLP